MVQVWSVTDPTWHCKITEGIAGLVNAIWAPDGRHVLTVAEFQLHLTIWSLLDGSSQCIQQPKHSNAGIKFSSDGSMLAVAHRKDCKDYVGIYSTESWKKMHYFPVQSRDLVDIQWASSNSAICVQESELEYNLLFYSIDGRLLSTYQAYENALGVKTMAIPPAEMHARERCWRTEERTKEEEFYYYQKQQNNPKRDRSRRVCLVVGKHDQQQYFARVGSSAG